MRELRFWLAAGLIGLGLAGIFLGIFGVHRFRFVLNRMHCAAILDTLGASLVGAGLAVAGGWSYVPKLICVLAILWVGSPIASHLVARLECATDGDLRQHMKREGSDDDGLC